MVEQQELKRCPFCGGKADVWTDPFFRVWKVFCTECGANILSNTDENADVLWNKRVSCDTCAMYFPNDGCMAGLADGEVM